MKPIGSKLSLEAVSPEYTQIPGRKDVGTESEPTFEATFEAVTFERQLVPSRKGFGTYKEPAFEATLSGNASQRDAITEADAAEQNPAAPDQRRVLRRRHFDSIEPWVENSSLKFEQGLSAQPSCAPGFDPAIRDRLQSIAVPPVEIAQHESMPERRPIVPKSTLHQRPGIDPSDEGGGLDISPAMHVRISEPQTHFLPSAMALSVITSREPTTKERELAPQTFRPFEVTREPLSVQHDSVNLAKTETAGASIPDLSHVSSMPQSVGVATTQVLSAMLVDRPSELDDSSSAEARPHNAGPNDRSAGSYFRMITIQMQPASLGLVQVVLRSTDRALSIRIEAQASETRAELETDRSVLVERLGAGGYMIDELLVVPMDGGTLIDQAQYDPSAFDKAYGLPGSGSDSSPRRPRRVPAIPLEMSDTASPELHVVPDSDRGAVVSSLQGPGRRLPRLV